MSVDYAEMVKKLQSESRKMQIDKAQIEADIFASIREAHNSLARAGARIEGQRGYLNLQVLPESTSSVTYTISQIPYAAIDDLEIAAFLPTNNANKFIIFKSESRVLCKLLNGERSFFIEAEENAVAESIVFYLQLMAEIVTFKTSK